MAEERFTRRTVTVVMAVIAALAFVFSFGNVWALALRLGVPRPIAPLIAPMVDLSVVGLLVALRFLALRGVPKRGAEGRYPAAAPVRPAHPRPEHHRTAAGRTLRTGLPGHCRPAPAARLGPRRPRLPRPVPHPPHPAPGGRPAHATPVPVPNTVPLIPNRPRSSRPPLHLLGPWPRNPTPLPPRLRPPRWSPSPRRPRPPPPGSAYCSAGCGPTIADTHRAEHEAPITAAQLGNRMGVARPWPRRARSALGPGAPLADPPQSNPRPPPGLVRHAPSSTNTPP